MNGPTQFAPDRGWQWLSSAITLVWALALADLIFHIYFNNRYGYFRDEFNYMACGDHLQWGYVDQPPLIPFLIHISRAVLGDSLRAIRFIPALASSLLLVQTAALARELSGRRYAQILSAGCILIAGMYLSNGSLLGTNCLEPNLWMGCAYLAILAIKRNSPRYWLWFGIVAGIGLEEKYSILIFGVGMVVGLLFTSQRRVFLNKWIWLGGLAAFLIFLPNLLWNVHYHWPFAELMRNIRAEGRDVVYGPVPFFVQQVMLLNPSNAPIWIIGLVAFFAWPQLRPYRALGWCFLACYVIFFALHGKNYYLSPIYPVFLAAGAVRSESLFDGLRTESARQSWRRSIVVALLISGAVGLPMSVPVLSPATFVQYMRLNGIPLAKTEHFGNVSPLPQWYSDQFGWKEIADEAVVAWDRTPADERGSDPNKACGIFAQDYGQAGAVDFFDRKLGLPPALSGDRTYWLWGPRGYSGHCMIVLGDRRERLEQLFGEVEFVGVSADNPWALEKRIGVFICRKPKFGTLAELWPQLKRWR
ncbi:MAG TPA: glycosyltransferase family 39 protein [Candidatus Acidoferrales bacterium]|nr:glycosyltransferase family 39 protein [Candidatus Acidoferrales bacterium]